ncbi:hypothetical protein LMXM_24_1435 [Leishmania mexicana MHOM/GT/2001/U1103]|uniref:Uncharacterized protein n=1 Tax=Leishmania mexicana (strain MHOM/GT/2001/U1103) TaxID=929439 RepID=E9AWY7_LEIMU|nr:hypothetical protein LMXM_24_1435 [Leishmania mexicana MHOM/GT/2001/U1103]CBZ27473.1 hypothetical protein LMXM_24_1435 [Leishmania mexicana MHOM/GT/2001/U1103]
MSASADAGPPAATVRQLRLRGGQDTDNSDSEEEKGGAAPRWRGGASAGATAGTRPTDAPQGTSLPTAAAATSASLPPRAGSSSSLELFTSSSSRSSSPARSELPPGLMKSTAAPATAALKDLQGEKLSGSRRNNGRVSDTHQRGRGVGNRERGGGDTAPARQQVWSAGSPVGALLTPTSMHSAVEEDRQTVPGKATAGEAAVVVEVSPMPSPATSASLAFHTAAVQPRSAAPGLFKGKEASPPTAIKGAAFTTFPTAFSADAAGEMSRPAAFAPATTVPSSPALPSTTSIGSLRTDAIPIVEAAVAAVYTGGPSEAVQESSRTSVGSAASPMGALKAPLAAQSSSSSLDGDPVVLAPVQIARPTSTGRPSSDAATATLGLSIRKLTVPFTTAAEVDTLPSSSSSRQLLPSTTRPSTAAAASAAAGRTATPAAASTASSSAFTAVPDGRSSALGTGSPMLSDPGSVVYNRVSAQGRGSVPLNVLEGPSRPKWCGLPGEHTASPSPATVAAQSAAISAAPPPPPGPVVSTQAAHAAEPTPAAARASAFSTSQPSVNLLTRPHRQAPRQPGATHTSAVLSLIEDDDERPRCSSPPASSTPSTGRNRAETGQPKTVSVQARSPPSSSTASPPSPPTGRDASSADGATSPLLSRSATVTAAQRQREAALVIYDDRVPPERRRAKRQAGPMTGQTAAMTLTDPMSVCVLRGLRTDDRQDGNREGPLTCRPILRIVGAGWRRSPVDWAYGKPPLDRRAAEDDDCEGVDDSDNATRGRLDHSAAIHGFSSVPTGHDQYPVRSSGEDRSAKLTMHSANNYTVQRLFSATQPQQPQHKARAGSYVSGTGHGESVPCVVMRLERQGARTASDVHATHGDVSSGGPSSANLPPAAASRRAAVSPLTDESVNVDLLNYRRSRRKQQR